MDIRKTDNKGRIVVGEKHSYFFVHNKKLGGFTLEPVPVVDALPEGMEYASVSSAKNVVSEIISDAYDGLGVDLDGMDEAVWGKYGSIHLGHIIVEALMERGVIIPGGHKK